MNAISYNFNNLCVVTQFTQFIKNTEEIYIELTNNLDEFHNQYDGKMLPRLFYQTYIKKTDKYSSPTDKYLSALYESVKFIKSQLDYALEIPELININYYRNGLDYQGWCIVDNNIYIINIGESRKLEIGHIDKTNEIIMENGSLIIIHKVKNDIIYKFCIPQTETDKNTFNIIL